MKMYKLSIIVLLALFLCGCNEVKKVGETTTQNKINEKVDSFEKAEYFFEYNDEVYFWKLNSESTSKEGIHNIYDDIPKKENELVKIDKKGKEKSIYRGEGSGKIIIYDNTIYTSYLKNQNANERMVYSLTLDGKKQKEYGVGFIEYLVKGNLICKTGYYDGNIINIDLKSGEYNTLKENAFLIGAVNDEIYYGVNSSDYKSFTIGVTDINKSKEIITVKTSSFEYDPTIIYPELFVVDANNINIYIGYTDGTAHILQELYKVVIKDKDAVQSSLVSMDEFTKLSNRSSFEDSVFTTNANNETKIVYLKDNNEQDIISYDKFKNDFKFVTDDEHAVSLVKGNATSNDAFFIVNYGTHKADGDIGWRYNYLRNKTMYIRYNISSKQLETIYEY